MSTAKTPASPRSLKRLVRPFRAGDIVRHAKTGEEWVLVCDEERGEVNVSRVADVHRVMQTICPKCKSHTQVFTDRSGNFGCWRVGCSMPLPMANDKVSGRAEAMQEVKE